MFLLLVKSGHIDFGILLADIEDVVLEFVVDCKGCFGIL